MMDEQPVAPLEDAKSLLARYDGLDLTLRESHGALILAEAHVRAAVALADAAELILAEFRTGGFGSWPKK